MPDRARWKLPNDARVAVYVVVNVEEWDIEKTRRARIRNVAGGGRDRAQRTQLVVA